MPYETTDRPITAYVGFGANLGEPQATLAHVLRMLGEESEIISVTASPSYRTEPVGGVSQDDFLNAVLRVQTRFSPLQLLDFLLSVEGRFGRAREVHWGPRTLDLDLLLYGDRQISHERLTVPHPEMHRRGFVLRPLCDLAPRLRHPVLGRSAEALLADWKSGRLHPEQEVRPAASSPSFLGAC